MRRRETAIPAVLLSALALAGCRSVQQPEHSPAPAGPVTAIAVSPGGAVVRCSTGCIEVTGADGTARLRAPAGRAVAAAAMPDGGFVLGGGIPGRSGWLMLLGADGTPGAPEPCGADLVDAVAAAPDGSALAGTADGEVLLRARGGAPRVLARHAGPCRAVAVAPDGATAISGGRDGRLLFVDLRGGPLRERLDHTAGIESLALDADGRVASGARDGRVRLHDAQGGIVRSWQRLGAVPLALLPLAPGWLAGCDDGRLLWLPPDREEPVTLAELGTPVHALARHGSRLLVGLQDGARELPWPTPPVPDRR